MRYRTCYILKHVFKIEYLSISGWDSYDSWTRFDISVGQPKTFSTASLHFWCTVPCAKRSALLIAVASCVHSHNAPDSRGIRHHSGEMEGQCVSDTPDTGYTRVGRLPNTAVHCSRTSEASSGQWFNYWPSHYSLCQLAPGNVRTCEFQTLSRLLMGDIVCVIRPL